MALCKHGKLIHPDDSCALCKLAQLETETLELKAALQDTVVDDYGYARDAFFNGMGNRKEYDRILAALAQPAIAKLPEAKDDGS